MGDPTPEEKVARRVLADFDAAPPVDVLGIAGALGELEVVGLPVDADAISINLKSHEPKIFLNSIKAATRQRFSLAHEIGHIVLPWHYGVIVSHSDPNALSIDGGIYARLEREANTFASELLLPRDWLASLAAKENDTGVLIKNAYSLAQVSPLAAAIRLTTVLGPGYVFAHVEDFGMVTHSGRSEGTPVTHPRRGRDISEFINDPIYLRARQAGHFQVPRAELYWWRFDSPAVAPEVELPDWKALLDQILEPLSTTQKNECKLSISGMFGAANNLTSIHNAHQLADRVRQSLLVKGMIWIAEHPLADQFLLSRAKSIFARKS